MISYCIAAIRPAYARLLVEDLVAKTSAPFEILVWLNLDDAPFEAFLALQEAHGAPVRIVGKSPENIGMRAYRELFRASRYPLVVQIDDDVVRVSRGIAERAARLFEKLPTVRQLVSDTCQDEYTTGARPPLSHYTVFDAQEGLYLGPIDGWFSIYHRSILPLVEGLRYAPYFPLGGTVCAHLRRQGMHGVLDTGMKVFHVTGPAYASCFGMLDAEIEKYRRLGRGDLVKWYCEARASLPPQAELQERFARIHDALEG
jgi:hypothetical protein